MLLQSNAFIKRECGRADSSSDQDQYQIKEYINFSLMVEATSSQYLCKVSKFHPI